MTATSFRTRAEYEREESQRLAPYASRSACSAGRLFAEAEHPYRTAFQRDRDRVIHSRAFRRLEYKTQVFVYHEGDHYRNRLTHTLEGAQIARTIARALRLNEDLAEAIALAHDLGHTPFGHAGERVLDRLMAEAGGFDHNRQSLRVVDLLEERYPRFRGLNLTWETREGIVKHGSDWEHPLPVPTPKRHPSLEAQVADVADEIAYTHHDVDDGLRSRLIDYRQLAAVPLWRETWEEVRARLPETPDRVQRAQAIVALIDRVVSDLVAASAKRLQERSIGSPEEARESEVRLVALSAPLAAAFGELKDFLARNLYHHPRVLEASRQAERVLGELFEAYRRRPSLLPEHVRRRFAEDGELRAIADYLAGMTDRFALLRYREVVEAHGQP